MKFIATLALTLCIANFTHAQQSIIQFVFTSDPHYGLTRKQFQGNANVDAHIVNAAMIKKMNNIPSLRLPEDSGVLAGQLTGGIDFVVEGGDIANRMEPPLQSAASSWQQFEQDYVKGIQLSTRHHKSTKLYIIPGNHDISNAVGYHKPMEPKTDASSMVHIYNAMMHPQHPRTNDTYNYATDKINYSFDEGGIHFMFVTLYPDSAQRIWMETDLKQVHTPVILFSHDQPQCEAKHFVSPAPDHSGGFENLTTEVYKDGLNAKDDGGNTDMEQKGLITFLQQHPQIIAFFHGNTHINDYYEYHGLPVFRADSPMKGKISAKDETRLSFQLVTIDTKKCALTVRECLWNTDPAHPETPVVTGSTKTIRYEVADSRR
ncbi:metallophosphoesterase family protein [Chitinophaga sancti]|uniref:metallophosphoesterase family protein n=1 Tax=Chitinophaga sancti TaxID=1004 RepID=UPI003F79E27C